MLPVVIWSNTGAAAAAGRAVIAQLAAQLIVNQEGLGGIKRLKSAARAAHGDL